MSPSSHTSPLSFPSPVFVFPPADVVVSDLVSQAFDSSEFSQEIYKKHCIAIHTYQQEILEMFKLIHSELFWPYTTSSRHSVFNCFQTFKARTASRFTSRAPLKTTKQFSQGPSQARAWDHADIKLATPHIAEFILTLWDLWEKTVTGPHQAHHYKFNLTTTQLFNKWTQTEFTATQYSCHRAMTFLTYCHLE